MNERQEQTADVLGKLTVMGTIVLPLNIICGMWGMNVKVPGQDVDSLTWFWSSRFPLIFTQLTAPWSDDRLTNILPLISYGWFDHFRLCVISHCQTGV